MTTIDKFYLASKREAISSIGMACAFGNQCEKDGKAYVEEFEEVSMYDSPEGHMLSSCCSSLVLTNLAVDLTS